MASGPGVRGQRLLERSGRRLEPVHPEFVTNHPTASGWIWFGALAIVLIVLDVMRAPHAVRVPLSLIAAAPALLAALLVLSQTPRSHLEYEESVLGHFFSRFLGLMSAIVLWMGSVVLGAAVAVQLAADAGTDPAGAWDEAWDIFAFILPFVVVVLWAALILRCVSYLARLRGWAAIPSRHRIPDSLLAELPRTRRVIVGLAHPGLLLASGLVTILLLLGLAGELSQAALS
ncbi:MAG: hypothetical protein K0R81_1613 [Microbacterium sp.]|jgi:hypothetical protein|nr:hypothetical protein [Microbacterium sp.]